MATVLTPQRDQLRHQLQETPCLRQLAHGHLAGSFGGHCGSVVPFSEAVLAQLWRWVGQGLGAGLKDKLNSWLHPKAHID